MGTDKGLMDFKGKPLVQYAIDLLSPFCDEILISTNQAGYDEFGFICVPDIFPECGPAGGLHAALAKSRFEWNLVLSCDVPYVNAKLFDLLLAKTTDCEVVVPAHEKGIEPMVAVYRQSMAQVFETNIEKGIYKLQRILGQANTEFVKVDKLISKYPELFRNLNYQNDIEQMF